MVYQHRNIMTLMYVFTHTYNIPFSTQQAAGNLPEELLNSFVKFQGLTPLFALYLPLYSAPLFCFIP